MKLPLSASPIPSARRTCQVCHQKGSDTNPSLPTPSSLLRCSRCKCVYYCSKKCQRLDWINGKHRLTCPALAAQAELTQLLHAPHSLTLQDAQDDYHKAVDCVKEIEEDERKSRKRDEKQFLNGNTVKEQSKNSQKSRGRISESGRNLSVKSAPYSSLPFFLLQDLPHLSCYQLFLRFAADGNIIDDYKQSNLTVSLKHQKRSFCTLVKLRKTKSSYQTGFLNQLSETENDFLTIRLPGKVETCSIQTDKSHDNESVEVVIRLFYEKFHGELTQADQHSVLMIKTPEAAQTMCCRFCQQSLLRSPFPATIGSSAASTTVITDNYTIEKVTLLPTSQYFGQSGHEYDDENEMLDYIMCYPGQMYDSNITTALSSSSRLLMEDESVAVVSSAALQDDAICVLAVTGYGEVDDNDDDGTTDLEDDGENRKTRYSTSSSVLVRGRRTWRDAVSGATVTCSRCAQVLGFAPDLDTVRFLKHCISWNQQARTTDNNYFSVETNVSGSSIATFVAHQMIRYADAKAIFTFFVHCNQNSLLDTKDTLVLRLLRWNIHTTISSLCDVEEYEENGVTICIPRWRRSVQVLYGETKSSIHKGKNASNDLQWMWRNDWCCRPVVDKDTADVASNSNDEENDPSFTSKLADSDSFVEISISHDEWMDLRRALQSTSNFYSNQVKEATIMAKTGRFETGVDLAVIFL